MQPTHNTLSENVRAQSAERLNEHPAAAFDLHAQVKQAQTRMTPHISDRPSTWAVANSAALNLHDRIEVWVNEGGAGGEDDEGRTRPRGRG
jgi:hypothetical protein